MDAYFECLEPPKTGTASWDRPGVEPKLEDMLADPTMQQVMKRDCVSAVEVRILMNQMRVRLMAIQSHTDDIAA